MSEEKTPESVLHETIHGLSTSYGILLENQRRRLEGTIAQLQMRITQQDLFTKARAKEEAERAEMVRVKHDKEIAELRAKLSELERFHRGPDQHFGGD